MTTYPTRCDNMPHYRAQCASNDLEWTLKSRLKVCSAEGKVWQHAPLWPVLHSLKLYLQKSSSSMTSGKHGKRLRFYSSSVYKSSVEWNVPSEHEWIKHKPLTPENESRNNQDPESSRSETRALRAPHTHTHTRMQLTLWETEREREGERERERERSHLCWINWNRTALPNRMLQIHNIRIVFYNKIQQTHPTFKTLPPGETSVSARRTQELLCVCCSYVSLCHHRRDTHLPWADVPSTSRLY